MTSPTPWYVIRYAPGPQWRDGLPILRQRLDGHAGYMQHLYDQGKIVYAGPFTDDAGGMAVILAADDEEAGLVMERDPAVLDGIFVGEVHPWRTIFNRPENRSLQDLIQSDGAGPKVG